MSRTRIATILLMIIASGAHLTALQEIDGNVVSQQERFSLARVTDQLVNPWGMDFLPDGNLLVTERPGRMVLIDPQTGARSSVTGLPDIAAGGQGGLLDVTVHPRFQTNRLVYFSYSTSGTGGTGTAIARGRLDGTRLSDVETIFTMNRLSSARVHYGSRLLFLPDGTLLFSIGDRGQMDRAQDPGDHAGSLLRINDDGSVPRDNPFVGRSGVAPEIYTLGNRNSQGLTLEPGTGTIWQTEHGPRGGDELNIIEAGSNYGWPVVSHGRDYRTGQQIGEGTSAPGMVEPVTHWTPAIAPGGMTFYTGDRFPGWRGNLFIASLVQRKLVRLEIDGQRVRHQEELLVGTIGRIRDVAQGPDGYLYVLTDESRGGLYRVHPVSATKLGETPRR